MFADWSKPTAPSTECAGVTTATSPSTANSDSGKIKISDAVVDQILFGKNAHKVNAPITGGLRPKKRSATESSKKPPKKQRIRTNGATTTMSVIAPIFKKKALGRKAAEYMAKVKKEVTVSISDSHLTLPTHEVTFQQSDEDSNNEDSADSRSLSPNDTANADSGSTTQRESSQTPQATGRPTLSILDDLTIEVDSLPNMARKYRCAGRGCSKTWQPRSRNRVLAHAKLCLHLPASLRQSASKSSAATSPGAQVAQAQVAQAQDKQDVKPQKVDVAFFGSGAQRVLHKQLDFAIVKLFCILRLPPALVDSPEWKELFSLQTPSYHPASRTTLLETHILSEQSNVRELQISMLKKERCTLSFDAGSIRSGEAVITVHATTTGGIVMLLEGQECTNVSHTGEYIATLVIRVVKSIGPQLIDAVSSDSTGNTSTAREIICAEFPTILNLPDPIHHLNNTWKEIASIVFFDEVVLALFCIRCMVH